MKTQHPQPHDGQLSRHGGAALIIVIAMTGMLAFLGFFFFSYVAAERNSAAWFTIAPNREVVESDYFDFALQQLLIGPPDELRYSALYGRQWSLLPNALGRFGPDLKPDDLHPFSGRGINVIYNQNPMNGMPVAAGAGRVNFNFDYSGSGLPFDADDDGDVLDLTSGGDGDPGDIIMNFSPGANPVLNGGRLIPYTPLGQVNHPNYVPYFEPDAGYTYPDINSMFLGYFSLIDIDPSPAGVNLRRVWIPSFHRPQYLPRNEGVSGSLTDIYSDATFANQVLRPHRSHRVLLRRFDSGSGSTVFDSRNRYVDAGGFDATFTGTTGPSTGFPFPNFSSGEYHAGVWTHGEGGHTGINYDVDADGLDINGNEAILMDLDHGVEIMADGTRRIPIYAITIVDGDGLVNLNTAGNLYGERESFTHTRTEPSHTNDDPFGDDFFVSKSNLGLSPGEINPARAFYRPLPTETATTTLPPLSLNYDEMFGLNSSGGGDRQVTQLDMANMELARVLLGVADKDLSTTDDRIAGRWGDVDLLEPAMIGDGAPAPGLPRIAWSTPHFPLPGIAALDDDNDWLAGGGGKVRFANTEHEDPVFGPLGITVPSVVHPIDEIGAGVTHQKIGSNLYDYSFHTRRPFPSEIFLPSTGGVFSDITNSTPSEYGQFRMARQPFADTGNPMSSTHNPSKWPSYSGTWELQVTDRSDGNADGEHQSEFELQIAKTGVYPWSHTYLDYSADLTDASTYVGALQPKRDPSSGEENLFLVDEPGELVVEPAFRNLEADGVFPIAESQFLHFSDGDWATVSSNFSSRLQNLAKFNLDRDGDPYDLAGTSYPDDHLLRSQFTTESWDRWEFAFSPAIGAVLDPSLPEYNTTRGWEFSPVNNDNTRLAFPPEFGDGSDTRTLRFNEYDPFRPEVRQWLTIELDRDEEYGNFPLPQRRLNINRLLDKDKNGDFRFRHLTPHPVFVAGDSDDDDVLDNVYGSGGSVVRAYSPGKEPVSFDSMRNDKFVQEWWARYDRQRMARDIYVLLYTLGGAEGNAATGEPGSGASDDPYPVDNTTTDLNDNGIHDNIEAMAQFAVNVVDALDRDSVITEFVYDTDLSDGWEIDGEKDSSGNFTDSSGETRSVFGVEAQQLTFSETYWVNIEAEPSDRPKTRWDDLQAIQFLFMELRNAAPFDVSTRNNTWRIRRIVGDDDGDPDVSENDDKIITFRRDFPNDREDDVRPGANFWVQLHSGSGTHDAHLYFDTNNDSTITADEVICPSFEEGTLDHKNYLDLNDSDPSHSGRFDGDPADFFAGIPVDEFEIVLERRAHPGIENAFGTGVIDDINPWVRVDYMQVIRDGDVDLLEDTTGDVIPTAFEDHASIERSQPLRRWPRGSANTNTHPTVTAPYRRHSIGPDTPVDNASLTPYVEKNSNCLEVDGVPTFTLWQPHFDRDFTSAFELLSVPIVGPDELTEKIAEGGRMSGLNTAFTKFAVPDPGTGSDSDTKRVDDNRWHRILGLLEVPTGAQQTVVNSLVNLRTPGKINLNTVRHPGVLAALIDDDFHLQGFRTPAQVIADNDAAKAAYPYLQLREPSGREPSRHWYDQFIFSRDRWDPYTTVPLPGIPGSRPFRPLTFTNVDDTPENRDAFASVEHTILRSLPVYPGGPVSENTGNQGVPGLSDGGGWGTRTVSETDIDQGLEEAVARRRLFEARTSQDQGGGHTSGSPVDAVDFHTRHRLLNKISNNSTVRSNVFYCWIHVQFHEAAEDQYGNVQVGGQLTGSGNEPQRAFFVLDRSKMEEAWDPRTQQFDWRKFVTFSRVLD